tara:strand:+ start:1822 stop:2427 length:606 start_codon:yes stop_codon:yes gene_type:complete
MKYLNIRGTSGTGKTHATKALMEYSEAVPYMHTEKGKPLVYKGQVMSIPVYFLGSYKTSCGGCDTIPSVKIVAGLLDTLTNEHEHGTIVFEGLMISHMIGTVGAKLKELGVEKSILAFLDTDIETAIQRVKDRRLAAGNTKPLNEDNTRKDHPRVIAARNNAIEQGFQVYDIDHKNAVEVTKTLLNKMLSGESIEFKSNKI